MALTVKYVDFIPEDLSGELGSYLDNGGDDLGTMVTDACADDNIIQLSGTVIYDTYSQALSYANGHSSVLSGMVPPIWSYDLGDENQLAQFPASPFTAGTRYVIQSKVSYNGDGNLVLMIAEYDEQDIIYDENGKYRKAYPTGTLLYKRFLDVDDNYVTAYFTPSKPYVDIQIYATSDIDFSSTASEIYLACYVGDSSTATDWNADETNASADFNHGKLTESGSVFFLGGGGGGTGSDECTATSSQVLSGYTAVTSDSDDEAVEGTMTNNGSVTGTVNCGASYTIPKGYHDGTGKVTGNSLSSQTSGTAAATDILSGKTAWVGGTQLKGSMTNNGAKTASLNCGGSYTIPAGYHNGSGKVTANTLASQTAGTATAANILSGKTAWVGGTKLTGSMTSVGSIDPAKSVSGYNPMYVRMTNGAHVTNATSGYPEVSVTQAQIISAIGITAAKIVKGNTILGLAGTCQSYKLYSGSTTVQSSRLSFTNTSDTRSKGYITTTITFTPVFAIFSKYSYDSYVSPSNIVYTFGTYASNGFIDYDRDLYTLSTSGNFKWGTTVQVPISTSISGSMFDAGDTVYEKIIGHVS